VKITTILVTGATGNIGRRIVDHLIDLGANDIRALTTNPARAKLPGGVTPVTGYLAPLPETLDVALQLATHARAEYVVALSGEAHWQAHADAVAPSGLVHTHGPGALLERRIGTDLHG
jgi:nucleoside-diphosphate-sugar epimerase